LAQITKALAAEHHLVTSLIPATVLKSIDQGELLDRLVYARELSASARSAPDAVLRRGYSLLAQAVLKARPRAAVAQESAALIAKAAGAPLTTQAAELRVKAARLLEEHPPAPRRADSEEIVRLRKGAVETLQVVYDAAGTPVGVCSPDAITPVAASFPVAKASAGKAPRRAAGSPGRR
jgi:hypothetical protein